VKLRIFITILLIFIESSALAQYGTTKTLAIPIFANRSGNSEYAWLNEAIADMLTTDIAATKKIRIVNRLDLKKIVGEQKFILSDLSSKDNKIKLGNMIGAGLIITGSYTIIGGQVRFDVKIFDVEKGISEGAASIQGSIDEIFLLEKKLALKVFHALNINLTDEDKISLLQIESKDSNAIEYNYKGIVALDTKKVDKAQDYFTKAAKSDPFYKKAKENLDGVTVKVKGKSLFSNALSELNAKDKQLRALKIIVKDFVDNYYDLRIQGKPEIITDSNKPNVVDVKVSIEADIHLDAVKTYIENLKKISDGDTKVEYKAKKIYYNNQKIMFFEENYNWFRRHYRKGGSWFKKLKLLQLKTGDQVVKRKELNISTMSNNLSKPSLHMNLNPCCDEVPLNGDTVFKSIPLDEIKKMDAVEIVEPPKD